MLLTTIYENSPTAPDTTQNKPARRSALRPQRTLQTLLMRFGSLFSAALTFSEQQTHLAIRWWLLSLACKGHRGFAKMHHL